MDRRNMMLMAGLSALAAAIPLPKAGAAPPSGDPGKYFRDIIAGSNGDCGYYCTARKHYDYVTGLGSPLTARF